MKQKAFSLIEVLVVVALFAVIGAIVSQSTVVSLQGSRKADATIKVRENLNQALNIIERQLRSAKSIDTCTGNNSIAYTDQYGNASSFSCVQSGSCGTSSTYVSSGSASNRLTSSETVCIVSCQFVCSVPTSGLPPSVDVTIEGRSRATTGVEDTAVKMQTSVTLRAY